TAQSFPLAQSSLPQAPDTVSLHSSISRSLKVPASTTTQRLWKKGSLATTMRSSSWVVPTQPVKQRSFSRGLVDGFTCSSGPTVSLRACPDTWCVGSRKLQRSKSERGPRSQRSKEKVILNVFFGATVLAQLRLKILDTYS